MLVDNNIISYKIKNILTSADLENLASITSRSVDKLCSDFIHSFCRALHLCLPSVAHTAC